MQEQSLTQTLPDDVVLSVRNVSKKFCRNLKRSMLYGMLDLGRGLVGARLPCERLREGEFWAVDEVSFDLKRGETLGIIGENGSGKSTLLRVLTGILPPDRGEVLSVGRVGGLIALTAGMHPHMTGLENIFLSGTIQGMSREEIAAKLDSIVEFAEVGEFIHAPLSTYSSGMHVRLGFAVAIHCEPDILLLDEVLAVGDLAFQRKCFQRLESFRNTSVTTILISHNLRQVERICDRALLLHSGRVLAAGRTPDIIDQYLKMSLESEERRLAAAGEGTMDVKAAPGFRLTRVRVTDESGAALEEVPPGGFFLIHLHLSSESVVKAPIVSVGFVTSDMLLVAAVGNQLAASRRDATGDFVVTCAIRNFPLLPGVYSLRVKVLDGTLALLLTAERVAFLRVVAGAGLRFGVDRAGLVNLEAEWSQGV
jgi:lipopolysaccharide transport system ATP-binding protein